MPIIINSVLSEFSLTFTCFLPQRDSHGVIGSHFRKYCVSDMIDCIVVVVVVDYLVFLEIRPTYAPMTSTFIMYIVNECIVHIS